MYAPNRTQTTVVVSSHSAMNSDDGGPISKVLVLNGDADSALASLLSELDTLFADETLVLPQNQRAALFDLRRAAYGY